MNRKALLMLPTFLLAVGIFAAPAMAALDIEFIAEGKAFVVVDGTATAGQAQFNVDLTDVMSVKMGFGDPDPEEGAENWLYGWTITEMIEVGQGYMLKAVPSDIEANDGAVPAPWHIQIHVTQIAEGRQVFAIGSGFLFTGKIAELEGVGV